MGAVVRKLLRSRVLYTLLVVSLVLPPPTGSGAVATARPQPVQPGDSQTPAGFQPGGRAPGKPVDRLDNILSPASFPLDVFARMQPGGQQAANSLQQSAISLQPSAISYLLSAYGLQPSAISYQLSANSLQQSAISYQLSAPTPTPSPSPTLTPPSPSISPSPTPKATASPSPSPAATASPSPTPTVTTLPTPTTLPTLPTIEKITSIVTVDKEALLTSKDGKISVKLPAGSFSEEVRVEMSVLRPTPSTGMRTVRLLGISAFAPGRNNARVSSLLKDATVTITNTADELRGLNYQSLRLYYLDETGRWLPVASQFNPATLTLTGTTNHFSYYGEMADPAISGPGRIMAFEADLHSGTVKASYPLELPPAPGGFKPNLQLSYDSGRVDGMKNKRALGSWVGTGWSLDAGRISYDDESGEYTLEIGGAGYELVRSGDSYYTKPDLFYKIVRDEANQKWEVWDRSGVYYQFGGVSSANQYYNKGAPSYQAVYYRWDLSLMRDTHSTNNEATVEYTQALFNGSVRSAYPTRLRYNNNLVEVVFNSTHSTSPNNPDPTYGELRPDSPLGSVVPIPKVMETRKLDSVDVKSSGNLVRNYTFAYNTTDKSSSQDYGGVYYSGKHTLTSITEKGADGASALPAMTFSYQDRAIHFRDADNIYYSGNPGNPATLAWPYLTGVTNGYGATTIFSYTQAPAGDPPRVWTRQVATEKKINPGIGPEMKYTYFYDGDPEYQGRGWTARYRGFRKVKETDAAGDYTWRYYYTTGYDAATGKDWEKLTGREYKTQQYSAGGQLLQQTDNTWTWSASSFRTPTPYTFLDAWDGFGSNDGYFYYPNGITANSSGNVYVMDTNNSRVQGFTSSGNFTVRWGGWADFTSTNAFDYAVGIASTGNSVYVADVDGGYVNKFDAADGIPQERWNLGSPRALAFAPDGYIYVTRGDGVSKYTSSWGGPEQWTGFSGPVGITGVSTNNDIFIFVADSGNNRIVKLNSSGTVLGQFNGSGYTPDISFYAPQGVAVDAPPGAPGYIYVADSLNHRVTKWNWDFTYANVKWEKSSGGSVTDPGAFNYPWALALSGSGDSASLYVSELGNHRVQKLPATGGTGPMWGGYRAGDGTFGEAYDIALATSGNYAWVVDRTLNEVKRFDLYGKHVPGVDKRIGKSGPGSGTGNGEFYNPAGMGISPQNGDIYVADKDNSRVQKFDASGTFLTKWTTTFTPTDVAVYWDQARSTTNVYVSESNHAVEKFDGDGNYLATFGNGLGTGNGYFNQPWGVAAFADGNVLVVDTFNHRIQAFTSTGQFLWKRPQTDSPAKSTENGWFDSPMRAVIDGNGNIYVADSGNNRVQKLDSSGNYLTKFASSGPIGLTVSPDGQVVYVAGAGYKRISKYTWLGEVRLEQTDVARGGKTSRTRYTYDGKGNVAAVFKDGDISTTTDDSTVWRLFQENTSTGNWMLDRVARERVYAENKSTDNGTGVKLETRYYYDKSTVHPTTPTKGDLTQIEKYDPAQGSSPNTLTFKKDYDDWGNVITETDASSRNTSYVYDAAYHTFVVRKTLPVIDRGPSWSPPETRYLTLEEKSTWNYTGARPTHETDVNGQTTEYKYDTFWRPVQIIRPGDFADSSPTIRHYYESWGSTGQQNVYTIRATSTPNNVWTKRFFDGLGRVVQTHSSGNTSRTVVTTTMFSDRGLVRNEYVPQELFSTSLTGYKAPEAAWQRSTLQYDALRRVTSQTKPDGTAVSHSYSNWQDEVTNERGKKKLYTSDAFDRLAGVVEYDDAYSTYAGTTYKYDVLDNLIEVKDTANNTTVINFNALSRKTSMTDPDMGTWSYEYDYQGNLTRQTDNKGQAIIFTYDELDRLKEKRSTGNTLAAYSYDDVSSGNYGYGRRTGTDSSGTAAGTTAYKYDARGRLGQEVRTVDFADYITRYSYDSADRVSSVQVAFKQSGNETIVDTVTQGYNGRGLPSSLTSSNNGTIVSSVLYNNLALPTEINLGNNTRTSYGYWGIEQSGGYYGKLYSIKTVKTGTPETTHQEVNHTWDAIGNLTKRENVKDSETETFTYDFLDRLTQETNFLFKFGDTGPSSTVSTPWHAETSSSGNTWVADWGNYRIAEYTSTGQFVGSFGQQQLSSPTGVTRDPAGNFFVPDFWNDRVYQFTRYGNYVQDWGGQGSGDGQFSHPADVVYNSTNNYVYVVDQYNHRVQYFDTWGTFVGKWGSFGAGNG
ncbi:MAG: hypothetical protein HY673_02960, partial [Chloroflexi bacterium]|nr:hypothetical protein [Chloroflexota bacterium]